MKITTEITPHRPGDPELARAVMQHPSRPEGSEYVVEIVADSVSPGGVRLTSFLLRYPLIVHAEMLRHRVASHSVMSARAIPTARLVRSADYVPWQFTSAQAGMVGGEPLTGWRAWLARMIWRAHGAVSRASALALARVGAHKQHANRLLSSHAWVTDLVTATEWDGFFKLRLASNADPAIRTIAMMMDVLYRSMDVLYRAREPKKLAIGELHAPFDPGPGFSTEQRVAIAAARCARLSYARHEDERPIVEDIKLAERLATDRHWSPFEHVAEPLEDPETWCGNFRGWLQARARLDAAFLHRERQIPASA